MERAMQQPGVGASRGSEGSQDYLLETYRWYVDSAERVSNKRASVNSLLLGVNAALATYFSLVGPTMVENPVPNIVIPITGILLCLGWYLALANFRQMTAAKAQVIRRLEESLPATVYAEERKMVEQSGQSIRPLVRIGNAMPGLFAVLYVGITWYCQSTFGA